MARRVLLSGDRRWWQAVGVATRLVHLVVDAVEPARLARFWAAALGWEVAAEGSEFCALSLR